MTKKHDIIWLDSTDSTNNEAKRRISDLDNLSVLSAYEQTAGRGQRGNSWSSSAGENLTFSIVLKYGKNAYGEIRAIDQFVISEIAALSVTDLLATYDIEAKIKWPNDIYVGNQKICGILIEHSIKGAYLSSSIIGIGLNVNQRNFDVSLINPTSMVLVAPNIGNDGTKFDIHTLLKEFMEIFCEYCYRYLNITGGYTRLRKLYLSQMWRLKETYSFIEYPCHTDNSSSLNSRRFTGKIQGLSDIGHLLVEDMEKGELKEFSFKEIAYLL